MANITISSVGDAASSSSMASSSASTSYSDCDVFINHRGPDVKNTFASHLYRRLSSSYLRVFLDREEMKKGENFISQIEQAIRAASVHIAIFSPRYAQSKWCLKELVLMVKSGATILPVFYKVDPSVVRLADKSGAYFEALRVLEQKTTRDRETDELKPRHSSDTIQEWENALSSVADIDGFQLHGDEDDEGELLDNVVKCVLKRVPKPLLYVAKHPTGLNLKLEEFEETVLSKQETQRVEAKVVGIVGMGGAGKTTLAKEFFNLRKSDYNQSSFLFEVRENIRTKGVNYLQSSLIRDLTHLDIRIESRDEGIGILRKRLSSSHALIVLDDIDNVSQLEAVLPIRDILSPDSLILATSRDKRVLTSSGVSESLIYNIKGLNGQHSEELFCLYAFNQPFPLPEFADLADRFVGACDGLPLSLKVFGALVSRQNQSYWEEILNELDKILPTTDIQEILKISYESLSSNDQQIFLDIACFFLGQDRDVAISIWGLVGFQNLQDKCLLEVEVEGDFGYWVKMHDHIRDLGRHISQGVMPRRLWQPTIEDGTNDIDDLLEQSSREITEVRGITMLGFNYLQASSEMPWYKIWSDELFGNCLRHLVNATRSCGISNLQLVAAEDGYYVGRILKKVRSPHLRWLRWYKCPYTCLPSWTPMENLRVLEVGGSRLKTLWQHESRAPLQLRQLIIYAPLFSNFPKFIGQLKYLEKIAIDYEDGVSLKSLPEEFGDLRSLKVLYLDNCLGMKSLPDSFGKLTNLQDISLWGSSLQMLPNSFGKLTRLKRLDLSYCFDLTISSATLGNITTLEYLNIINCRNVGELPPQVAQQRSLKELQLFGANLKELPSEIGNLCNLEVLSIGNEFFEVLPPFLSYLKSLKQLYLRDSPRLKYLPDHFSSLIQLEELSIENCGIEYLPQDLPKMNNLRVLKVRRCPLLELPFKKIEEERETSKELNKLESVHDNDKSMFGLTTLQLTDTETSEVFFAESVCPNLRSLWLDGCQKLTKIGGLCGLSKLQSLSIKRSIRIEELPNIEMLISLEGLSVNGCVKLKSIPGLGQLRNLRYLDVSGCHEIVELSGAKHLMLLKTLVARDCPKLRWDEGVLEEVRQRLKEGFKYDECNVYYNVNGTKGL